MLFDATLAIDAALILPRHFRFHYADISIYAVMPPAPRHAAAAYAMLMLLMLMPLY